MKEKRQFASFQSHLDLAHQYWEKGLKKGVWAIDATCGNGHDTLYLAQICAGVIGLDVQEKAINNTKIHLEKNAVATNRVHLFCQSHETFPPLALEKPIHLIVYNLGYLPGEDKSLMTRVSSTLNSLQSAFKLIVPGGMVSITCYPGHKEGAKEEEAILSMSKRLNPSQWSVSSHGWLNRQLSPSLILIQRSN